MSYFAFVGRSSALPVLGAAAAIVAVACGAGTDIDVLGEGASGVTLSADAGVDAGQCLPFGACAFGTSCESTCESCACSNDGSFICTEKAECVDASQPPPMGGCPASPPPTGLACVELAGSRCFYSTACGVLDCICAQGGTPEWACVTHCDGG